MSDYSSDSGALKRWKIILDALGPGLSEPELMERTGAGKETIRKVAAALDYQLETYPRALDSLPPGLTVNQVAKLLDMTEPDASRAMAASGYGKASSRWKVQRYDWLGVDWSMTDTDIAVIVGCTKEAVRIQRAKRGLPPSDKGVTSQRVRVERWMGENPDKSGTMSARAIAELLGVGIPIVYIASRRAGFKLPLGRRGRKLSVLQNQPNYDLPNRDINAIWSNGINFAASSRLRLCKGPAKWDVRGGRVPDDPEYLLALAEEERRAAEYFAGKRTNADVPAQSPAKIHLVGIERPAQDDVRHAVGAEMGLVADTLSTAP